MTENMKKLLEIVSASKELGVELTEADFAQNGELSDDELDTVAGGYGIGDTVRCSYDDIAYCSNCGRLLKNYEVTITGVRGVLNGKTLYWVTRNCCGHMSSIIETEILD